MDDDKIVKLEQFLPYRLSVLSNLVSNAIAEDYRGRFGLSIPDWRVIAVLARYPDSSAQELVAHTRMDKVAVSRSVSRLLERELIERMMAAADRRRSVLKLSELGEGIYLEIMPRALSYEKHLLQGLSLEHRAVLDEVLDDLLQAATRLGEANHD